MNDLGLFVIFNESLHNYGEYVEEPSQSWDRIKYINVFLSMFTYIAEVYLLRYNELKNIKFVGTNFPKKKV